MYLRSIHAETHIPALRQFIRANPLGEIITTINLPSYPLIQLSHVPFILDVENESDEKELGTLRGHMARANPQSKAMIEELTNTGSRTEDGSSGFLEREVMVLFNSSAHHYITPKFYKETKPSTAKVVPTWNYSAVQAYGKARIYFDSKSPVTDAYLDKQVAELSEMCERNIMGYDKPWETKDAPEKYLDIMKKAIIGVQIDITSLGGKAKMSQESTKGDREGVIEGFEAIGTDLAKEIAETVRAKSNGKK
ncbi:negative transcriptional regulator [Aaosphaeria arxii CBS 175.79]|uniref:Negative transcriptional regulator n=1 Tax=Aaosphaeria arxii CBS 175.79 TaxID=1450172 RepID=A0A6A5XMS2_9PLEO|nr:negative transcriptional regulator [Aaosphaeria arxii CBS 175.79]KAF2014169.1 negative transcriptional regulator [Aaosphaeria arxii CBS 175.79]